MRCAFRYLFVVSVLVAAMAGCKHNNTPVPQQETDGMLVSGRLEYYGAFYRAEGIDYDVISLDLYSKGVWLNSEGRMEGTGTNLYISDIFVPAVSTEPSKPSDCLLAGTYYSGSTAQEMHFLRGVDYDGNYGGSYVLLKSESGYSVLPITAGEMTVAYSGDRLVLEGQVTLEGKKEAYTFHYQDTLPIIHRKR